MLTTLEVYIVCVRKLFIWGGERKKKKICLSGIEKKRNLGILGSQINSKIPNNSKPTYLAKNNNKKK
jgi:hypothetical protein